MKICPRCNAECEDKVIFCISCGLKFEKPENTEPIEPKEAQPQIIQSEPPPPQIIFQSEPPAQPLPQYQPPSQQQYQPQPPPQYQQPAYGYAQPAPYPQTPATDLLKRASSSPLFLVFVLAYSILVALQLFKLVTTNYGGDMTLAVVLIVAYSIGWLLSALTALGLWLHFSAAKSKKIPGMKTSGLALVKVCTIITFVFVCIGMGLIFIALLLLLVTTLSAGALVDGISGLFGYNIGISSIGPVIVCIIGIVYLIAVIFVIIYYAKIFKSIRAVSTCAETGSANYKLSSFVPVANFLMVLFYLLSIVMSQFSTFSSNDFMTQLMGSNSIVFIAQTVLNAITLVTISVAMFAYNSKLKALNRAPAYNAYGQR